MHIVQILPELNQGGVETIVLALNRELTARGHQSTVISNGGELSEHIEQDGGRHIKLDVCSKNPLSFLSRTRALRSQLRALNPSLIHIHSRVPGWLAWFANKRLRIPWVTTVHGYNSVGRYSSIMTKGDRVICVSHPIKEYILTNYPVDPAKVTVIHCGINLSSFDPERVSSQEIEALKKELHLEEKKVITTIGRITELKDYETFIRAIALAAKSDPTICGLIVGDVREDKRAYHQHLIKLVAELKMEAHIQFLPHFTSLPALYALSEAVVSCSKKPESFGLTLIESLAMNTPVIATRHGGPLDIITEGENGSFFEPRNAEALAELLHEGTLPKGPFRTDIADRFSITKMVDSTLSVYNDLTAL